MADEQAWYKQNPLPWLRDNFDNVSLRIGASIVLVVSVLLAFQDHTASATVMAGLFAVTMIFTDLRNIESFKAWGVEAKRIRDAIQDAKASLEQFKKLTSASSYQTFYVLSTIGQPVPQNIEQKDSIAYSLLDLMKEVGFDDREIKKASKPYADMVRTDLGLQFNKAVAAFRHSAINQPGLSSDLLYDMIDRNEVQPGEKEEFSRIVTRLNSLGKCSSATPAGIAEILSIATNAENYKRIPEKYISNLDDFGKTVIELMLECAEQNHLSPKAMLLLRKYASQPGSSMLEEGVDLSSPIEGLSS